MRSRNELACVCGALESGARKFGSTINKISGNKIGESEFGKKVYSAYDKVAEFRVWPGLWESETRNPIRDI